MAKNKFGKTELRDAWIEANGADGFPINRIADVLPPVINEMAKVAEATGHSIVPNSLEYSKQLNGEAARGLKAVIVESLAQAWPNTYAGNSDVARERAKDYFVHAWKAGYTFLNKKNEYRHLTV